MSPTVHKRLINKHEIDIERFIETALEMIQRKRTVKQWVGIRLLITSITFFDNTLKFVFFYQGTFFVLFV